MLSIVLEYEAPRDRTIIVKMPDEVQPGRHELIVVINEPPSASCLPGPCNADVLKMGKRGGRCWRGGRVDFPVGWASPDPGLARSWRDGHAGRSGC